ncbi:MAG: SDR family NAD(P)-dependent oxidoreductase, partial [Acholeplasmataceae bacterium]
MKNKLKIRRYLEQFDSIENQTFIITGANSGLGYSTTKHLASLGAHVVMACRNLDKAELAKNEIKKFYPNAKLSIIHYDQADFKSIDLFVEEVFKSHADFKSIILNAGIYHPKKGLLTKDGYPLTMG